MRENVKKIYDMRDEASQKALKNDTDHLSLVKARFYVEGQGVYHIIVHVSCNKTGVVKELCDILGFYD